MKYQVKITQSFEYLIKVCAKDDAIAEEKAYDLFEKNKDKFEMIDGNIDVEVEEIN